MAVARLTQAVADKLTRGEAPERDVLLWGIGEPGLGLKRAAGSARTSWVYQWRDPDTGKSHRFTLGDARKLLLTDARKAMRFRAGEIANGKNPVLTRRAYKVAPTFAELVERYRKSDAWKRKAPSTQAGDARRLQLYLLPALGHRKLVEITTADLKALTATLSDPAQAQALARKGGATKATKRGGEGGARRTMRVCKAILSYAYDAELITDNPGSRLKLGADGRREVVPDDGAYARLWRALDALRGSSATMDRACDVIALLALTGARRSEIRLLRWRQLDLAGRRIVLGREEHKGGRRTGKARIISLPDEAVAILAGYAVGNPDAFVFAGSAGGPPVALQRPWRRVAALAGLDPALVLHSLRHGVGSALAAAGMQAPQIAAQLGHSGWKTSERYVHRLDTAMVALAQRTAHLVRPPTLRIAA